ncbi:hypothetical protein [Nocardia cyriacigeorgica]|uniref:hypothetical protein n=1 Tax=Nocardia cyriacigeorgica TaxID=135487 RepID=UPI002455032E|nr:hypothetical protein [Nocardia cyriacigeorgica]
MITAPNDQVIPRDRAPIAEGDTDLACDQPIAERMLQRIAVDENLHMIFSCTISGAVSDPAPDSMLRANVDVVTRSQMLAPPPSAARNSVAPSENRSHGARRDLAVRAGRQRSNRCVVAVPRRAERAAAAG